jgi:uncharacterized protein YwgA
VENQQVTQLPPESATLNASDAALMRLVDAYAALGYRCGASEVQKLAYFLQEAGEPMRLKFEAHHFGPYAENLNHALQHIEGHFIRGYGDRSAKAEIRLVPGATERATEFLRERPEAEQHLERVKQLIEGFETPYGMELLSTVHWVVTHETDVGGDLEAVRERVVAWNERKKNLMKPQHIQKAYSRLERQGWFAS